MFRALALRQSESRNCGLCKVYIQKMEPRYRWKLGHVKNRNKLVIVDTTAAPVLYIVGQ